MLHVLLLVLSAAAIYLACEWFVNAVEWLGQRLRVGAIAVGTILAAVGTALPESVVTFVAVVFGGSKEYDDIGVGAAMGGPLALATVAYAVVGLTLLARRRRLVRAGNVSPREAGHAPVTTREDVRRLARDQTWFLAVFVVKVSLGLVAFAVKPWFGLLFLAVYAVYFWRELASEGEQADAEALPRLRLTPRAPRPRTVPIVLQTLGSLAVIFVFSQVFVRQLEWAGPQLGLAPTVVALLLSPLATELPEVLNALIWVRAGKTQLALANISGAMMIQATVPSALGLLFTPWQFDAPLVLSGAVTMLAIGYLLTTIARHRLTAPRLALAGAFYLGFVAVLPFTV